MICPFCKQSVVEDEKLGHHLFDCQKQEAALWDARFAEMTVRSRMQREQEAQ